MGKINTGKKKTENSHQMHRLYFPHVPGSINSHCFAYGMDKLIDLIL